VPVFFRAGLTSDQTTVSFILAKQHKNCRGEIRAVVILLVFGCFLINSYAVSFEQISNGFHSIQSRRIQATLQFLASKHFKGRATGSPEAELTADYIASIFQRNGLQPPPGNSGSYVQVLDLVQAVPQQESLLKIELPGETPLELKIGEDFLPAPWGFESTGIQGQAVFAGYGISAPELRYDDFAGLEVRNKVVVVLSKFPGNAIPKAWDYYSQKDYEEPFEKALRAQNAGAAAFILILPSSESIPSLSGLSFKNAKTFLSGDARSVRIPAVFVSYATGEKLIGAVQPGRQQTLRSIQDRLDSEMKPLSFPLAASASITTVYDHKSLKGYNVIGVMPGSDPELRDQYVLLGAHHDHLGISENQEIYFGADDDASGTTGLLELAEAFQVGPLRPRRSIVLAAWAAEELGLLGSRHYAQQPLFPLNRTVAMIQLDMIGRNEQRAADPSAGIEAQTEELNHNTVSIAGSAFSQDLKHWIETGNQRVGLTLRYRYDSGQENLLKRSDHWCFLKAGIPSVFFFTGFHPDYHRTTDTADKINYAKMERILRLLYLAVWEVADQTRAPRFISSAPVVKP
jgi:Peptidase family M28/PA domain